MSLDDLAAHVGGLEIEQRTARPLPASRLWAWVATVDHKQIGILYLVTSLAFFIIGGVEALAIRTQLILPNAGVLTPEVFNQFFTLHGTTMIFFVVMPSAIGFANYLVPLMIGARDVAFPRLNALSYWLFLFGGLLLYFSVVAGGGPNAGWFAYPPLSLRPYSSGFGVDYWALGLLVSGIGTIAGALNLIVTIFTLRAPGLTLSRMPLFVWTVLVTGFLILWAMPTLTAAGAMIVLDRAFGANFFQPRLGGDPVLYQHLFWWLGHPEVYIMFLPFTGVVSEVIPVFARKPIFGYGFVAASTVFIGFYSMFVWAHHMYAVGLSHPALGFFSFASLLIAVPTGVKIFNWLATMYGGSIRLTTAMLFAMGMIANFTIGGLTGVAVALVPFDWQVTDSYYVVAHLHYVLVGGSLNGLFAGTYYWFPKVTGRFLDERLGRWHFWLVMVGITLTFLPMHVLGIIGMPRRVYTYPADAGLTELNLLVTLGSYILGVGMLVFFINIWRALRQPPTAGPNPWGGATLEWATASPPPPENFVELPTVRSRFPLWEVRHPDDERVQRAQRGQRRQPLSEAIGGRAAATEPNKLSMLLFISSEVFFFGSLLVTFLVHRQGPGLDTLRTEVEVPRVALFSLALFASSATVSLAGRQFARGNLAGLRDWLLATIALGLIFLGGQALEYRHLLDAGVNLSTGIVGSAFFTLTGFHGLHVLGGLVALLALWSTADLPAFRARGEKAFEPIALYWHFVDVVWVFILGIVYLWSLR